MTTRARGGLSLVALVATVSPAAAQSLPTDDPVIRAIWTEAMDGSQAWEIGQALLDSLGPRLTGTPSADRANDWAVARLQEWGVEARVESYGTWKGWERADLTDNIRLGVSGTPSSGGSDHASFICAGAPAFSLWSDSWDYFPYTWHTNLDTFDKIVWENVRRNAALYAMLAYLAAEDERVPRDRRVMPIDPETGERREWPACEPPDRQTSARYQ